MAARTARSTSPAAGESGLQNLAFTIAGPGHLGQAIGRLLHENGVTIRHIAARRADAARRAFKFIGAGSPVDLTDPKLLESDVILLTIADGGLAPLAARWAQSGSSWRGKVVLHTSGAVPAAVLDPLKKRGADTGSLHPFQTVPSPAAGYQNLRNSFWAIEGNARACRIAVEIAHTLDGLPFRVHPALKALYHAGAVLSCGAVVALLDQSAHMLRKSGVPSANVRPMLGEFVAETLRNYVALGGRRALTGPAARGDWQTIEAHLRAMRRHAPGAVPVYRELLKGMIRLAGKKLPRRIHL